MRGSYWPLVVFLVIALVTPAAADERPHWGTAADDIALVTPRTKTAINKGLAFLARTQNPDGSFGPTKYKIAVTAFAGMSFLAGGNTPGRGRYGEQVEKALVFILDSVSPSGYITGSGENSRMHGQGLATLFLAEVYGMTRGPGRNRIRKKLAKALKLIQKEQTPDGGWGYHPNDLNHEGSITVTSLQALRAARDVGFKVSRGVLIKALDYLIKSANPDGSFKYRLTGSAEHKTFPLTAAAISTLNAFGIYDKQKVLFGKRMPELPKMLRKGIEFMNPYLSKRGKNDRYYQTFYYYGQFYAAQAYYKSRYNGRRLWKRYYTFERDDLLSRFDGFARTFPGEGCWSHARYGKAYATAIATLILQIPYKYLPTFQR